MSENSNYNQDTNINPFDPSYQTVKKDFANLNKFKMSDNQGTNPTSSASSQSSVSQSTAKTNQAKPKEKKLLINDYVKTKKGLYTRIKRAYLKRIVEDIDSGKKHNTNINKFIFDLLEMGLSEYEKK